MSSLMKLLLLPIFIAIEVASFAIAVTFALPTVLLVLYIFTH